jgi:alginate O-acetyltransferase complex protein AlgI
VLNLFVVWALTGLWHGASWNFVFWGVYYFVFLLAERGFMRRALSRLPGIFSHLYVIFAVFFGWIIFRFSNMTLGWTVFLGLFGANGNGLADFAVVTQLKNNLFLLAVSIVACTPMARTLGNRLFIYSRRRPKLGSLWETAVYSLLPALMLLFSTASLVGDSYNPFIYFQF